MLKYDAELDAQAQALGGGALYAFPQTRFGRVRFYKGGGGNSAEKIERERQERAAQAIAAINSQFDNANRQALYDQQRQAVYDLNTNEVNRQALDAERNNRFAMARNGLLGGSVDIDSNAELNRRTNEGLAQAAGIADSAMADLIQNDETTRNNLISMANAGTDATTAGQMAANGLKQNAEIAKANSAIATVGNLFNDISNAYLYNNFNKSAQQIGQTMYPYLNGGSGSANKSAPQNTYSGTVG